MEKKPRIPIFSSLMDSSGFPFRSIDQLAIQSGQFCLIGDPIICFQPWKNINTPFTETILSKLFVFRETWTRQIQSSQLADHHGEISQ